MVTSDNLYHNCNGQVAGLSEETIKRVLSNSGLTEKEAEVYILLAKHNPLKTTEIAKLLKKDNAQVFHILKKLQVKGFVESTLEFPARYTVVPFETILNSIIKTKREEVNFIEDAKKDLLDYLREKGHTEPSLWLSKGKKGYTQR